MQVNSEVKYNALTLQMLYAQQTYAGFILISIKNFQNLFFTGKLIEKVDWVFCW